MLLRKVSFLYDFRICVIASIFACLPAGRRGDLIRYECLSGLRLLRYARNDGVLCMSWI